MGERPDGEQLFREKFVIDPSVIPVRQLGIMGDFDVFANVIVMTPKEHADRIYEATGVFMDSQKKLACGITHLPNDAGLLFKVLGMEPTGKETCPGLLLACPSGSKGTSCSPRIPPEELTIISGWHQPEAYLPTQRMCKLFLDIKTC